MARRHAVRDFLAAVPLVDQLPAMAAVGVWWFALDAPLPDEQYWNDFLVGVATVAGLTMAAATFVCALTYQSSNILMTHVRRHFATELKRNWTSIIAWAFAGAAASIIALFVATWAPTVAIGAGIYSLAIVTLKAMRSLYWLTFTLFGEDLEVSAPRMLDAPTGAGEPRDRSSNMRSSRKA